jgi:hypothetical protein
MGNAEDLLWTFLNGDSGLSLGADRPLAASAISALSRPHLWKRLLDASFGPCQM